MARRPAEVAVSSDPQLAAGQAQSARLGRLTSGTVEPRLRPALNQDENEEDAELEEELRMEVYFGRSVCDGFNALFLFIAKYCLL